MSPSRPGEPVADRSGTSAVPAVDRPGTSAEPVVVHGRPTQEETAAVLLVLRALDAGRAQRGPAELGGFAEAWRRQRQAARAGERLRGEPQPASRGGLAEPGAQYR